MVTRAWGGSLGEGEGWSGDDQGGGRGRGSLVGVGETNSLGGGRLGCMTVRLGLLELSGAGGCGRVVGVGRGSGYEIHNFTHM